MGQYIRGIRITVYDPAARESRSMNIQRRVAGTNSNANAEAIAEYLETKLGERYVGITRLSSRRHKRR